MDFHQALNAICDSEKVTRKDWKDKKTYCFMYRDRLSIHIKDTTHDWIISWDDLLAEDWLTL